MMDSLKSRFWFGKILIWDFINTHGKFWVAGPLVLVLPVLEVLRLNGVAVRIAMWIHRINRSSTAFRAIERIVHEDGGVVLSLVEDKVDLSRAAARSIVVRWPILDDGVVKRKGILIVTFTDTFNYYLRRTDVDLLCDYFDLVLEPSWAGYMDPAILSWSLVTRKSVYVQASELSDRVSLMSLCSNLVPLSVGASDWVDRRVFRPIGAEKRYDSIYVANTSRIKRVHIYFRTIRQIVDMGETRFRALLVCASWGGAKDEIRRLLRRYGVASNCDVMFGLPQSRLNELLNQSKFNVLLSRKEGSNRSLFEGMFSGVPVVGMAETVGPNKCYFNEHTGILCYERELPKVFIWMASNWNSFPVREWALENIAPERTIEKICDAIMARSGSQDDSSDGCDCYVKVNSPEVAYFDLALPQQDMAKINELLLKLFACNRGVDGMALSKELGMLHKRFQEMVRPGH